MQVQEFIEKNKLSEHSIDIEQMMTPYLEEMVRGLDGEKSSLRMIPTYITPADHIERETSVICVDIGGTNLRIARASFAEDGNFNIDEMTKYLMPGSQNEVTSAIFFDILADLIAPLMKYTDKVAISFAFPGLVIPNYPNIDYEILTLTKEVRIEGIGGHRLGEEIRKALRSKGVEECVVTVLNDAVASCLAGKADRLDADFGTFTGTILGTGSNSCYIEAVENIRKPIESFPQKGMIINTEAGNYSNFACGHLDKEFDACTQDPDSGVFEKMTSGRYLGELCDFVLRVAGKDGVLSKPFTHDETLKTADIGAYLDGKPGVLSSFADNEYDAQAVHDIIAGIVKRAGRLLALQMSAMAVKSMRSNDRICMSVEGTTYQKMNVLREEALRTLNEYLDKVGLTPDVFTIENAVLKGCAIAGLSK